jgi:hypothetical protein
VHVHLQDLVAGLDFVKRAYPEIDADRMVRLFCFRLSLSGPASD